MFTIGQLVQVRSLDSLNTATRQDLTAFFRTTSAEIEENFVHLTCEGSRVFDPDVVLPTTFRIIDNNGRDKYRLVSICNAIRSNWVHTRHLKSYSNLLKKLKD